MTDRNTTSQTARLSPILSEWVKIPATDANCENHGTSGNFNRLETVVQQYDTCNISTPIGATAPPDHEFDSDSDEDIPLSGEVFNRYTVDNFIEVPRPTIQEESDEQVDSDSDESDEQVDSDSDELDHSISMKRSEKVERVERIEKIGGIWVYRPHGVANTDMHVDVPQAETYTAPKHVDWGHPIHTVNIVGMRSKDDFDSQELPRARIHKVSDPVAIGYLTPRKSNEELIRVIDNILLQMEQLKILVAELSAKNV